MACDSLEVLTDVAAVLLDRARVSPQARSPGANFEFPPARVWDALLRLGRSNAPLMARYLCAAHDAPSPAMGAPAMGPAAARATGPSGALSAARAGAGDAVRRVRARAFRSVDRGALASTADAATADASRGDVEALADAHGLAGDELGVLLMVGGALGPESAPRFGAPGHVLRLRLRPATASVVDAAVAAHSGSRSGKRKRKRARADLARPKDMSRCRNENELP
jgi:hypothetical protein